jgi:hypothetical protein
VIDIPVLLIGFNRPDTIAVVFDCIRAVRPAKIYVALDGPRVNKDGEVLLCNEVKAIVKEITWDCEKHYLFNEENKGAEVTVSSAVSWALKYEEYVIVLEDDIVATKSFFYFMQEMLIRYKDCTEIAMVSGCNPTPIYLPNNEDYLFGIYGHTWGWGTWKRAWSKFDLEISNYETNLKSDFLDKISNNNAEKNYFKNIFTMMLQNGAGSNTWDYCWFYIRLINGWLSVIPRVNLTSNIGIYGLHAMGSTKHHFQTFDENFKAENHPKNIKRNIEYDIFHFKKLINRKSPLYLRVLRKASRMIKAVLK